MASGSSWFWSYAPVDIALRATIFALFVIGSLIFYIWARRYYRGRLFARRDARAYEIRKNWQQIVSLSVPPDTWRKKSLDRELIETILLDQIDVATAADLQPLLRCFRDSGLLDLRIYEARTYRGWKRQSALAALGRTREPEAIAALSEALDSKEVREVTSAVRGLGRIGLPEAAVPMLDRLLEGRLNVPHVPLKSALANCCRSAPELLLKYISGAGAEIREILARALAEVISPACGDDLSVLCQDPSPEVRASVARALGEIRPEFAAPVLSTMTMDEVWFVRVRAVISLAALNDRTSIEPLTRCVCDPNRVVRQRAAMALIQFQDEASSILKQIIAMKDKYGLHSYVSELQRSGRYGDLLRILKEQKSQPGYPELIRAVERASVELSLGEDNLALAASSGMTQ